MDDIEREAIRAEGLDPDDRAVVTAIDMVRWVVFGRRVSGTSTQAELVRSTLQLEATVRRVRGDE